jgi:hypothetical protein
MLTIANMMLLDDDGTMLMDFMTRLHGGTMHAHPCDLIAFLEGYAARPRSASPC